MIGSILLIDDNELDNFISSSVIRQAHCSNDVKDFNSAEEALAFLESAEANHAKLPDLIFLDVCMPGMDGFAFLDNFQNLPEYITQNIKIAMLSSSINKTDKERSFGYPWVIKFINKPLSQDKIADLCL